jgi:hypothetical protein
MNGIGPKEIKSLKTIFILHFIFYAILIVLNFIFLSKIIWINKSLYNICLAWNFCGIIFFIFPIVPFIFLLSKKLAKDNVLILKKITLIFCIASITLSLFFSYILMTNSMDLPDFYKECPYNIPFSDINEESCSKKICILNYENENNQYPYEYLCNFDSSQDFKEKGPFERKVNETEVVTSDSQIICEKYQNIDYDFQNEIINNYLNTCTQPRDYFICQRFNEPNKFSVDEILECPNYKYIQNMIIISIVDIVINLILGFISWRVQLMVYNKIIKELTGNDERKNISMNSTQNCTKVIKENDEENFKKTRTEIIIVCSTDRLTKVEETNKNINQNITNNNINIFINKNLNRNKNNEINLKNNKEKFNDIKEEKDKNMKVSNPDIKGIKILNFRSPNEIREENKEENTASYSIVSTEREVLD